VAGDGALSELFDELVGKAVAVGQVDLVGLKVDVGSDRAGRDRALSHRASFRWCVGTLLGSAIEYSDSTGVTALSSAVTSASGRHRLGSEDHRRVPLPAGPRNACVGPVRHRRLWTST
jgi:hypothetical protein